MSLTSLRDGSKWTTNSLLQSNSEVLPAALLNHFQIHIFLLQPGSFATTILAYKTLAIKKHQFRSPSLNWHRSENYDIAFRSLRSKAKWFIAKCDRRRERKR